MEKRKTVGKRVILIVQIVAGILFLFPLIWMIVASFKPESAIFSELCYLKGFSFTNFTLSNYAEMFQRMPILQYLLNSVLYIAIIVFVGLVVNSMAGYALAKIKFPGRNIIMSLIIAFYIVPFESVLLPEYLINSHLHMLNSYASLAVPFIADCFSIFLFRQFFLDIPNALIEAAYIDGASTTRIFTSIVVPNSKPVYATAAVLVIVGHWGDFLWPLMAVTNQNLWTVQMGIAAFFTDPPIKYGPIMAALTISSIPMIVVFMFLQKYYVQGITSSGIK